MSSLRWHPPAENPQLANDQDDDAHDQRRTHHGRAGGRVNGRHGTNAGGVPRGARRHDTDDADRNGTANGRHCSQHTAAWSLEGLVRHTKQIGSSTPNVSGSSRIWSTMILSNYKADTWPADEASGRGSRRGSNESPGQARGGAGPFRQWPATSRACCPCRSGPL